MHNSSELWLHRSRLVVMAAAFAMLTTMMTATAQAESYSPHTPSQFVECAQVDQSLARIPHGDGDGVVTDEELGPGGWRYNGGGRSFVTFAHELVDDDYVVKAGRSNVGANTGIINDYPTSLDLPQAPQEGALVFDGRNGAIVLSSGSGFTLPGSEIRINVHDPEGDGTYVGCAQSPLIENFGFTVPEGGDFVQREYFKAYAETDGDGVVSFYEWTEVSTFNNTNPDAK